MSTAPRIWVAIPAAGVGRRMSGNVPKQYLSLAGRTVIEWSMDAFLGRDDIAGVMVAIGQQDSHFRSLNVARNERVKTTIGGAERSDSVLRTLESLSSGDDDWVLVHDAVRPCLHSDDLSRLISDLRNDAVGGLLAIPVSDTLKSVDAEKRVTVTVARENLWRAQTPQMFRIGILRRALQRASATGKSITDESAAVEALGLQPRIVVGRADNIKITVPEDLRQAEYVLQQRMRS